MARIKTESNIYQMFLNTFFCREEQYPFEVDTPSPGHAKSLAQKLNQCRKQHVGDAPSDICPYSASANGNKVTIAKRQQQRSRSASWIEDLKNQTATVVETWRFEPAEPTVSRDAEVFTRMLAGEHVPERAEPRAETPEDKGPPANMPEGFVYMGAGAIRNAKDLIQLLRKGYSFGGNITEDDVVAALNNGTRWVKKLEG